MPEGPEIRLAADRIAKALVGKAMDDVELVPPALRPQQKLLLGATVTAIDTRGKAMLTRFDNGLTLYSHNQLYGKWYVTRRDRPPKTGRSLRVALHTTYHSAWLYSASDIELLDEDAVNQHPFLTRLGPDVLDPVLRPVDIRKRLEDLRFRRRSLAALYLDQAFLAGIGNYLRSEILFSGGVYPFDRPIDLDRTSLTRLASATLRVSRRAYKNRGVTVTQSAVAPLKKAGQRYPEYRHWVFARPGTTCRVCDTPIEKHSVSGRSLFLCPECQPGA